MSVATPVRTPKIHLRKSQVVAVSKIEDVPTTELVLRELYKKGVTAFTREQLRRHLFAPESMSKATVWALYELLLKLRRDSVSFNASRIAEILRLIAAAPARVSSQVPMPELVPKVELGF